MSENVLSRNQQRALAALLQYATIGRAAEACGLSEKTLQRYLEDKAFRAALTRAEGDRIGEAGRLLVVGQKAALKALADMITDPRAGASNRRLAAVAWLDYLFRYRDLVNVEERLTALEAAIYDNRNK